MAVSKEVRNGLTTVFLPPHDTVVDGVDMTEITDEQDKAYNAWCTAEIKRALQAKAVENKERIALLETSTQFEEADRLKLIEQLRTPMVRTRYPSDDFESEDVVALDSDGEIVVLDVGSR